LGRGEEDNISNRRRVRGQKKQRRRNLKYLRYSDKITDALGNTLEVPNPSRAVQRKAYQDAVTAGRRIGLKDSEITYEIPTLETPTYADAIIYIANRLPCPITHDPPDKITPQDTGHALKVIRAFASVNGGGKNGTRGDYLTLEDESLTWLKERVSEHGTCAFKGATSAILLERLGELIEGPPAELVLSDTQDRKVRQ
jgi:hypothetical protein